MAKKFTTGLSVSGFRKIAKQIHNYRKDLTDKCEEFAYRMAEEGVKIARLKILSFDAVMTGELLNSMNLEAGDIVSNGSSYYIYILLANGQRLLSLVQVSLEKRILIRTRALLIGSMTQTIVKKKAGFISMTENGIGQKVCRQDRLCMKQRKN